MSKEKWTDGLFAGASVVGESLGETLEESLKESLEESFEQSLESLEESFDKSLEESFGESPDRINEPAENTLSLEAGLQHLEKIVNTLEQKDLPLEKALSLFKEGVGLVQYCSGVLNQAEKQMEILLVGSDGELKVKPASMEMEG